MLKTNCNLKTPTLWASAPIQKYYFNSAVQTNFEFLRYSNVLRWFTSGSFVLKENNQSFLKLNTTLYWLQSGFFYPKVSKIKHALSNKFYLKSASLMNEYKVNVSNWKKLSLQPNSPECSIRKRRKFKKTKIIKRRRSLSFFFRKNIKASRKRRKRRKFSEFGRSLNNQAPQFTKVTWLSKIKLKKKTRRKMNWERRMLRTQNHNYKFKKKDSNVVFFFFANSLLEKSAHLSSAAGATVKLKNRINSHKNKYKLLNSFRQEVSSRMGQQNIKTLISLANLSVDTYTKNVHTYMHKPGYQRKWRHYRSVCRMKYDISYIRQHNITKYVVKFYKIKAMTMLNHFFYNLKKILINTNFWYFHNLNNSKKIKSKIFALSLNGRILNNWSVKANQGDFIRLPVLWEFFNIKHMFFIFSKIKKLKFYNKYSLYNLSHFINSTPDAFLKRKTIKKHWFYNDVYKFLEICYLTQSCVIIYEPAFYFYQLNETSTNKEFPDDFISFRIYNWKYIN